MVPESFARIASFAGALSLAAPVATAGSPGASPAEIEVFAWDGSAEDNAGWQTSVSLGEYVQYFEPASAGGSLTGIAVCLTGLPGTVTGSAVVYAADGAGGAPGTLLAEGEDTAIPVPAFPQFQCTTIALPAVDLQNGIFGGFRWTPNDYPGVFIGVDTSPQTPLQNMQDRYQSGSLQGNWQPVTDFSPQARALGIGFRVSGAALPCLPDATTLCLHGARFRVEATWQKQDGTSGSGSAVPLTDDAGYFWFFNSANIEIITKVLNGCFEPFNSYWVFAAGLTNVEVTLTVTDTRDGATKTYRNPLGTAFLPIQDTAAFATCP
jgi:hypothetical protein